MIPVKKITDLQLSLLDLTDTDLIEISENLDETLSSKSVYGHQLYQGMTLSALGDAVGTVRYSSRDLTPYGYLPIDGSVYLQELYPELYEHLGIIGNDVTNIGPLGDAMSGVPVIPSAASDISWSPDGNWMFVIHGVTPYIVIIDLSDWSIVSIGPTGLTGANVPGKSVFSPDGQLLSVALASRNYISVFDTASWDDAPEFKSVIGVPRGISWSKDSDLVAVAIADSQGYQILSRGELSSAWYSPAGVSLPTLSAGEGYSCRFSPDGKYLAIGTDTSPYLSIIDLSTWTLIPISATLTGTVAEMEFSPDGRYLSLNYLSSTEIVILNTSNWDRINAVLPIFPDNVVSTDWTPAGHYLSVTYIGAGLTIIDTSDWKIVEGTPTLSANNTKGKFSPNLESAQFATASDISPFLTVYDLESGYLYDDTIEFRLPENHDSDLFDEGVTPWICAKVDYAPSSSFPITLEMSVDGAFDSKVSMSEGSSFSYVAPKAFVVYHAPDAFNYPDIPGKGEFVLYIYNDELVYDNYGDGSGQVPSGYASSADIGVDGYVLTAGTVQDSDTTLDYLKTNAGLQAYLDVATTVTHQMDDTLSNVTTYQITVTEYST